MELSTIKELFSIVPHLASLLRLSDVFPCVLCVLVTLIKQTKIISWKPGDGSAKERCFKLGSYSFPF